MCKSCGFQAQMGKVHSRDDYCSCFIYLFFFFLLLFFSQRLILRDFNKCWSLTCVMTSKLVSILYSRAHFSRWSLLVYEHGFFQWKWIQFMGGNKDTIQNILPRPHPLVIRGRSCKRIWPWETNSLLLVTLFTKGLGIEENIQEVTKVITPSKHGQNST